MITEKGYAQMAVKASAFNLLKALNKEALMSPTPTLCLS